jgi:hypothetical protein
MEALLGFGGQAFYSYFSVSCLCFCVRSMPTRDGAAHKMGRRSAARRTGRQADGRMETDRPGCSVAGGASARVLRPAGVLCAQHRRQRGRHSGAVARGRRAGARRDEAQAHGAQRGGGHRRQVGPQVCPSVMRMGARRSPAASVSVCLSVCPFAPPPLPPACWPAPVSWSQAAGLNPPARRSPAPVCTWG